MPNLFLSLRLSLNLILSLSISISLNLSLSPSLNLSPSQRQNLKLSLILPHKKSTESKKHIPIFESQKTIKVNNKKAYLSFHLFHTNASRNFHGIRKITICRSVIHMRVRSYQIYKCSINQNVTLFSFHDEALFASFLPSVRRPDFHKNFTLEEKFLLHNWHTAYEYQF